MGHGDTLEVKDDDTAEDLGTGFEKSELQNDHCRLEDLIDGVLARVPVAHAVDHHAPAAGCTVSRHRHYVVVADVPHLHRVHVLVDLRVLLLERVVAHDLEYTQRIYNQY